MSTSEYAHRVHKETADGIVCQMSWRSYSTNGLVEFLVKEKTCDWSKVDCKRCLKKRKPADAEAKAKEK